MSAQDTIYKDKIDVFFGGLSEDMRIQRPEISRLSSHLDIWTNPKRMTPYRAMEADQNTSDAAKPYSLVMFRYFNSTVYALGIVSASAKVKIYQKTVDPITGQWSASTSGEDGGGSRSELCFIDFHNYLYGGTAGTRIWAWGDASGAPSFTGTAYTVSASAGSAQGLVTTDDLLLIPCGNVIAKKNGAGSGPTSDWSSPLTLPSMYTITDLCEYGDVVAILAAPTAGVGSSKLFIWDKVSQDPQNVIDCGEGQGKLVENIEGQLVVVMQVGGSSAFAIRAKLVVKIWEGGSKATQKFELQSDDNTLSVYGNHSKFLDGNRLYFSLKIKLEGVTYNQLFSIGRKTSSYPLAYSFDRLINNDTAVSGTIQGLLKLGDYCFVAYNQDGSINRTNDQAVYTNASPAHITQKLTGERQAGADAARKAKQLAMAGALFVPLTSGQSVSLYWRKDASTSWSLIRTVSTVGATRFEAGAEDDGTEFGSYQEKQFKLVPAGGAEPTAIIYAFKVLAGDLISD